MSTKLIGVVGPSQWSYIASRLAAILDVIITTRRIKKETVPDAVYLDAKEFFSLIQAAHTGNPVNPPASFNAYDLATEAICSVYDPPPQTSREVERKVEQYITFFGKLQQPRRLLKEDVVIARSMKKFLEQIWRDGEAEAYQNGVRDLPDDLF